MKSNWMIGLMLALPLAAFSACGSDDDTTADNGGAGGHSAGGAGHAGHGGESGSGAFNNAAGAAGEAAAGGEGGNGNSAASGNAGEGGEGGLAGAAARLDDAQIVKVLSTANDGEVMAAQAAKPALQNSAARTFAQMMIDDHTTANGQTLALVSSKHLAPEPSALSDSLEADTAGLLSVLSTTPASMFDKVYIDSQVTMHQKVLGLIDSRLLPSTSDADVKTLLGTLRTSVAAHLSSAQTISASLP